MKQIEMSPSSSLKSALINGVIFQLVWIACVAGGGAGLWWAGPAVVFAFALWHIPRCFHPRGELALAVIAAFMGLGIDTALLRFGLLRYPEHGPLELMAPVWIVALWVGFSLTLNHSLSWLHGRPAIAAFLGGVSGPFSYWIGARAWNAVEFAAPTMLVLAVLAAVWAIATPTLIAIARQLSAPSTSREARAPAQKLTPVPVPTSEKTVSNMIWRSP